MAASGKEWGRGARRLRAGDGQIHPRAKTRLGTDKSIPDSEISGSKAAYDAAVWYAFGLTARKDTE
jgi:hypothetical protein